MRPQIILLLLLLAGCGAPGRGSPTAVQSVKATIGKSGFATIPDAPPAPVGTLLSPPIDPPVRSAAQQQADRSFARAAQFQNSVMSEVTALGEHLRRSEPKNFVDLYFENEGDPHIVFRFLRDPAATLRRYTRNPKFFAAKADYSNEELRQANDYMWRTFRDDRVLQSTGMGNKANRVEVELSVPEAEFRALVASKHATIPAPVVLSFREGQSAVLVNAPLPPRIAMLVKAFPRDDRPNGPMILIMSMAKVVLVDGCFRIRGGIDDGALVVFPLGAQLFVDRENYLAFGNGESPDYARVGEELAVPGGLGEVTARELAGPVHRVCGPGKVVKVSGTGSAHAFKLHSEMSENRNALIQFRRTYGLSPTNAQRALDVCVKRGNGVCRLSPPPPSLAADCPAGTRMSSGLCRNAEGFVRPVPKWLKELLASP